MIERLPSSPLLDCRPESLAERLFVNDRRALLFGQPGIGKTTLAARLVQVLASRSRAAWYLGADPGSPLLGLPGAVSLATPAPDGWHLKRLEALCTLDAARFRLPLVSAVRRTLPDDVSGTLLLDPPGLVRGVAGAETLMALAEVAAIDLVLVLVRQPRALELGQELDALARGLGIEMVFVAASEYARRPGKGARERHRTRLWDDYLDEAEEHASRLGDLRLLGTPPRHAPEAWQGKQIAFLDGDRTRVMGEVTALVGSELRVLLPPGYAATGTLLIRDACRGADRMLTTGKPFAERVVRYVPPADLVPPAPAEDETGPRPTIHLDTVAATLVNGVFGDPLLHIRLQNQRRSLLFDIGDGKRLPARLMHQVSDLFISHAHADHIGGFLGLLRSRIGETTVCRIYGPPGISTHIQSLVNGILWDRIGDRGPRFRVAELGADRVSLFALRAGSAQTEFLGSEVIEDGVLLDEPGFRVRAAILDHGTPVLAFCYEPAPRINIREERLAARGLAPGPWLNELKRRIAAGDQTGAIELPDGNKADIAGLARDLTRVTREGKLAYATDFADTPENRIRLRGLARNADTLVCEASFMQADREQAARTWHLTTHSCGAIANLVGARHLVPFHFSRRYQDRLSDAYREIAEVCPQIVLPSMSADD